jgi:hypothetical protein
MQSTLREALRLRPVPPETGAGRTSELIMAPSVVLLARMLPPCDPVNGPTLPLWPRIVPRDDQARRRAARKHSGALAWKRTGQAAARRSARMAARCRLCSHLLDSDLDDGGRCVRPDPFLAATSLEAAFLPGPAGLLPFGSSGSVRRAVVKGDDIPLVVPSGENPGASNQALGGKFGLPGHENATFGNDDGGVRPKEPDALRLVKHA